MTCEHCDEAELEEVDKIFQDQIFPVLTPLAVGPGRPFPYISNLSLSLAVTLRDPDTGMDAFARVKVPKEVVPRFIAIGENTFVPLESVIARNLHELFPGMEITAHDYFRVTRDADFTVSDEADDLVRAVEQELRQRRFGEVVRLEVGDTMEPELRRQLVAVARRRGAAGLRHPGHARPLGPVGHPRDRRVLGPPRSAVHAGDPAGVPPDGGRREAGPVRGDAPAGRARPLPVRVVRGERRAVRRAGRQGPGRARDQDDRVPDLGRLRARSVTDRGVRGGQAGGLPGGAEGALRRAPEHHVGARTGGGGRACRARPAGRQDARQGPARGEARGRRRQALPERRHRQLPREDRAHLRGLRALHRGSAADGGRRRPVQLADGLRPAKGVPQGGGFAPVHAGAHPRRDRQDDRGAPRRARRRASS